MRKSRFSPQVFPLSLLQTVLGFSLSPRLSSVCTGLGARYYEMMCFSLYSPGSLVRFFPSQFTSRSSSLVAFKLHFCLSLGPLLSSHTRLLSFHFSHPFLKFLGPGPLQCLQHFMSNFIKFHVYIFLNPSLPGLPAVEFLVHNPICTYCKYLNTSKNSGDSQ